VNWSRAHWLVGLLTLIVFPLTGAYMLHLAVVPNLDSVPRLVFRSRHLFLLLSAVANLALSNSQPARVAQRVAGALVLISPVLLLAAFFSSIPQEASRAVSYSTLPCMACSQRECFWQSPTGLEVPSK
jgi:hypothetical protein